MDYTTNYQLPVWAETDRILMDDFNDLTEKIEEALTACNCQFFVGSYLGTGTYGSAGRTTFSFPFPPLLAWVIDKEVGYTMFLTHGCTTAYSFRADVTQNFVLWNGNTASWYCSGQYVASEQMNWSGRTYHVYAIGAAG